jgi:DNA-binding YbaB/EbfC family protein
MAPPGRRLGPTEIATAEIVQLYRRAVCGLPPRAGAETEGIEGSVDPSGQLDMQQLLAAAAQMQSQLMTAQQELAEATVQGTAGGGLVTAVVNGQGELVDITIAAAAIDPADPEDSAQTIADLVLAACRAAYDAAADLQQELMGPFAAGFGEPGGGSGLPGLPGMPDLSGLAGPSGLPGLFGGSALPGSPSAPPDDPGTGDAGGS